MKASILIFAILLFTTFVNSAEQTLKLQVLATSNRHYIAVAPSEADIETAKIEIKESRIHSPKWLLMKNSGSFWELDSPRPIAGFRFPLSIRLTSVNGETVTSLVLLAGSLKVPLLDLGVQYSLTVPITAPKLPTHPVVPTPAPLACSGIMKVMVPLYTAPGADWDLVAESGRLVKTVAIIKPTVGGAPDALYLEYMQKLHDAGVDIIGYVSSAYASDLDIVKATIDDYALHYPYLSGVYIDQVSASRTKLPYYQELYAYVTSMPGWTYAVLNPGIIPDPSIDDMSTQVVSFEDFGVAVASSSVPIWASCEQREKFVAFAHSVPRENMEASVDALFNKQYIGYIYVTDGALDNILSTYYASLTSYISSKQL